MMLPHTRFKALPTLSVTPANASSTTTLALRSCANVQNKTGSKSTAISCIPFPSSPSIDIPSPLLFLPQRDSIYIDDIDDNNVTDMTPMPFNRSPNTPSLALLHRRSFSALSDPSEPIPIPAPPSPHTAKRARTLAGTGPAKSRSRHKCKSGVSMNYPISKSSSGSKTNQAGGSFLNLSDAGNTRLKSKSTIRTRKRAQGAFGTDVRFLATVHRSIAWRAAERSRCKQDSDVDEDGDVAMAALSSSNSDDDDDYLRIRAGWRAQEAKQDKVLVERLWCSLLARGCAPTLFPSASQSSPLADRSNLVCLDAEQEMGALGLPFELDFTSRSDSIDSHLSVVLSISTQDVTPTIDGTALSGSPVDTVPVLSAEVLSMPQLVASLLLRRHEPQSKKRTRAPAAAAGSCANGRRSSLLAPH